MNRHEFVSPIDQQVAEVTLPKTMEELSRVGAVVSLADIGSIWHGRAGENPDEWKVDPFFVSPRRDNAYDETIYATPHLEDAEDFAKVRAYGGKKARVERLEPIRPDLYLIKTSKRSESAKELVIGLSEGAPVTSQLEYLALKAVIEQGSDNLRAGRYLLSREDIDAFASKTVASGINPQEWGQAIDRYCRTYNSAAIISRGKFEIAADAMLGRTDPKLVVAEENGQQILEHLPLSKEYIQEVFRRAGIVGVQKELNSATLGRKIHDTLVIWDISSVQTHHAKHERVGYLADNIQPLMDFFREFSQQKVEQDTIGKLRNVLQDPYSRPSHVLDTAHKIPEVAELLDKPAGVWEGYTIGEHTEATLQMFERYFADQIPAEAIGLVKTALFIHDIGKGVAVEAGHQGRQQHFNQKYAAEILKQMGYSERAQKVLLGLIGPAATFFSDYFRYGKHSDELADACKQLSSLMRTDSSAGSYHVIKGFSRLLYMCDAGAYTKMARFTKSVVGPGRLVVRTAESLDHLFEHAPGGTTSMRLKERS